MNRNDLLDRQEQYCSTHDEPSLVDGQLFIESIRKLGYKNPSAAIHELADNSIQALAESFQIYTNTAGKGETKISDIAFVDDGVGMIPEMLRRSVKWGGTDRHNDRKMFGRFGFGLPSASVSQGRRYEIYSRTDGNPFYSIAIDVDDLGGSKTGEVIAPSPVKQDPPDWVLERAEKNFSGGRDAINTVIIWQKLDSKKWRTIKHFERQVLWRLGVTYRGFLRQTAMKVNDKAVEPIDPLFINADSRYFEPQPDGAEPRPGTSFQVKDEESGQVQGEVRIRYAYMPFEFLDAGRGRKGESVAKARFEIRKENNGIVFTRNGRQIDVLQRTSLFNFQNNDRYIGVEVDFDPSLDELFGITTSKQSVTLSDRGEQLLENAGIKTAISEMSRAFKEEAKLRQAKLFDDADGSEPRASEEIMEEIATISRQRELSDDQQQAAADNLEKEAQRQSKNQGRDADQVKEELERETLERPYKIERERSPEAPFYRVEQRGAQLVIWINTAHRFYTDVYAVLGGEEGGRVRAGLELLMFTLGSCEVHNTGDGRIWYQGERVEWSRRLSAALAKLDERILRNGIDVVFEEPVFEGDDAR